MPVPGTTASAVAVSIATLSGFCIWQSCIDDDLTMPTQQVQDLSLASSASAMEHEQLTSHIAEKLATYSYENSISTRKSTQQILHKWKNIPQLQEKKNNTSLDASRFGGFDGIKSSRSTDVEGLKSMAPRAGVALGKMGKVESSLGKMEAALGKMETALKRMGVGKKSVNKEPLYTNRGIHSSIEKMLSIHSSQHIRPYIRASMEDLMPTHDSTSGVGAPGAETTITNTSIMTSCSAFLVIMTIGDLLLAFFFVSLCRRLRSRNDSASSPSVKRPMFVKAPQPPCQDVNDPAPPRKVAGSRTRPLFMKAPQPSFQPDDVDVPKISGTAPTRTHEDVQRRILQAQINATVNAHEASRTESSTPSKKELQDQINTIVNTHAFMRHVPCATEDALKQQINAIVSSRVQERTAQSPAAYQTDKELQNQMNAIVKARREEVKQSPAPCHAADTPLQDQINSIVQAHAKSLKQQRRECADESAEWASPWSDLASPSPAQSMSEMDFAAYANAVLSGARERSTPGNTFTVPEETSLLAFENHVAPCRLSFADDEDAVEPQTAELEDLWAAEVATAEPGDARESKKIMDVVESGKAAPEKPRALTVNTDVTSAEPDDAQESKKCMDAPKPFDVTEIPSPTRNRAKRQALLAKREKEQQAIEIPAPEQQAAETLAEYHNKVVGEMVKSESKVFQEQPQLAEAMRLREAEERLRMKEEMAAMDEICVETFLKSVKHATGRTRVRTPLKGTNLYTKHMRPCRPAGTSVDVKDSNFRSLGFLMEFLESEGLLDLQPGLTDPVVTKINFSACAKYKVLTSRLSQWHQSKLDAAAANVPKPVSLSDPVLTQSPGLIARTLALVSRYQ